MKIKPLPCPFCGKLPKFHYIPESAAAPELEKGFWSLGCNQKSNCHIYPAACGDKKKEAVEVWNKREEGRILQHPISKLDRLPLVARCGGLMVLVRELTTSSLGEIVFLRCTVLEGVHRNDNGNYGVGDAVNIGPISSDWKRLSLF